MITHIVCQGCGLPVTMSRVLKTEDFKSGDLKITAIDRIPKETDCIEYSCDKCGVNVEISEEDLQGFQRRVRLCLVKKQNQS